MAARQLPLLSPPLVAVLAAGMATFVGLLIAVNPALGVGFVLALVFVPIAFLNLRLALILTTPIPFIQYLPVVSVGPTFALLVLLAAWLGGARDRRLGDAGTLGRHASLMAVVALMLVWLTLSIAASEENLRALGEASNWYIAAFLLVVFATTLRTGRDVQLVTAAFVFGAVLSVSIGLAATGLQPADSALETATHTEGRLQGGSSDPNYLAAGLVPAILLAGALISTTRSALARGALTVAIAILAIGLAATQSRGGFMALVLTALAGIVLLRRQRAQILAGVVLLSAFVGLALATTPGAWERVTAIDGGGNGRSDLWTVAWRISQEHPVAGVGLSDFAGEAHRFVRRPGQLTEARQIVDRPHVAHNTYLQVLTELGIVGLVLFLALLAGFLTITFRAMRLLYARGDPVLGGLTGAILVAQLSWLAALFFISAGADRRLWILLALGVVAHGVASRMPDRAQGAGALAD